MAPFAGAPALIAGGHAALPPAVPVPARSPALERRSGGSGGSGFPDYFVYIGMAMAIVSSTLNGVSFVLQKKGILDVEVKMLREGREVKHGHVEYLKSWVWWTGTACMVFAEVTNLVAYSFAPSVLVAPMGSMSVFVTAILSTYFLKEQLSFEAKVGVFLTVIGSIVVVLQSPNSENPVYTIGMFWNYMARWWAILWAILCLIALGVISLYLGPRYGKKNVLVYITAAAIGGSWLVQLAGAVGASVIYSFSHWETDNAFRNWSLYVLVLVIAVLAVYQVLTTNRALADHGAGIVMPIFYVMFTTATMITFAFLYAGASTIPGVQVATLIMGFLVISCGVAIL
ncbi:magnesium transporter, partial [Hyaloraphidium curvatum]